MLAWFLGYVLKALFVLGLARVLPGVRVQSLPSALAGSAVYALLSALLWKVLFWPSLPFLVLSLGLFWVLCQGFLLWLTGRLVEGFEVRGRLTLAVGALAMSLSSVIIDLVLGKIF